MIGFHGVYMVYYKHKPQNTIVIHHVSNKFIKIIPSCLNSNGFFGGWGFPIPLPNRKKKWRCFTFACRDPNNSPSRGAIFIEHHSTGLWFISNMLKPFLPSQQLTRHLKKMMVGRILSFWNGTFSTSRWRFQLNSIRRGTGKPLTKVVGVKMNKWEADPNSPTTLPRDIKQPNQSSGLHKQTGLAGDPLAILYQ